MNADDILCAVSDMMERAAMQCREPKLIHFGPDAREAWSEYLDVMESIGTLKHYNDPDAVNELYGVPWIPMQAEGVALSYE